LIPRSLLYGSSCGFFVGMEQYTYSFRISITVEGKTYSGTINPFKFLLSCGIPYLFRVVFNEKYFGDLRYRDGAWECEGKDKRIVEAIGDYITLWYR
jgi:hypothetical protein